MRHDELWVPHPVTGAEKQFRTLMGFVSWGNQEADDPHLRLHGVMIGGEQADGKLNIFAEKRAEFGALSEWLISWKDRGTHQVYVSPSPPGLVAALRDVDGLSHYKWHGYNRQAQVVYVEREPKQRWPSFRGYHCVAALTQHSDYLEADPQSAHNLTNNLLRDKRLLVDYQCLPVLGKCETMPPRLAYDDPIFRSFIFLARILYKYALPQDVPKSVFVKRNSPRKPWGWKTHAGGGQ